MRARLSPDGQMISYLAPSEDGVMNVWVQKLGEEKARMVTQDDNRGISVYLWAEGGKCSPPHSTPAASTSWVCRT